MEYSQKTSFAETIPLLPLAMCVGKKKGNIFFNEPWVNITGSSEPSAFRPDCLANCVTADDVPKVQAAYRELESGNNPTSNVHLRMKPENGRDRYMIASLGAIRENGVMTTVSICLTDITEAAAFQHRLEKGWAITAHEIRNRLHQVDAMSEDNISSLTETIASMKGDIKRLDQCLQNTELISASTQQQKTLMDDILIMAASSAHQLPIHPALVCPRSILQETVKRFENQARQGSTLLQSRVDNAYLHLGIKNLKVDPLRLRQILDNLVGNALKFTSDSSRKLVDVAMSASKTPPTEFDDVEFEPRRTMSLDGTVPSLPESSEDDVYLMFKVKDDGPGMTVEERSRLFKEFSQANEKTHVQFGGFSIGLSVCKLLTGRQDGQINVSSAPGKGSTFAFYIKTQVCDRPPSNPPPSVSPLANSSPSNSSPSNSNKRKREASEEHVPHHSSQTILIVDDNLIILKAHCKALEKEGYQVEKAENGEAALKILMEKPNNNQGDTSIKLILMDMEMPVLDGYKCTEYIRRSELIGRLKGKRIHIVCVSGYDRESEKEKAMDAGCDTIFIKTRGIGSLKNTVNGLLRGEGSQSETTEEIPPEAKMDVDNVGTRRGDPATGTNS